MWFTAIVYSCCPSSLSFWNVLELAWTKKKNTIVHSHSSQSQCSDGCSDLINKGNKRREAGNRFSLSITIWIALFLFFVKGARPAMYQLCTLCFPLTILSSNNFKVSIHVLFPWKLTDQWLHIFPGQLWSVFCRRIDMPVVDFEKVVDAEARLIH